MASNLFGPGTKTGPSAEQIRAEQDAARAADQRRAGAAAGRGRRSIGGQR